MAFSKKFVVFLAMILFVGPVSGAKKKTRVKISYNFSSAELGGTIAGGVVLALFIIGISIYCCYKKKVLCFRKNPANSPDNETTSPQVDPDNIDLEECSGTISSRENINDIVNEGTQTTRRPNTSEPNTSDSESSGFNSRDIWRGLKCITEFCNMCTDEEESEDDS
ncbi:uncharacterized protein [Watersipora subatra]|uniref:uncharacterized protein n=1 Tax=Watersipora subatra TaxID=2589382 RepID=UPI00355C9370